MIIVGVTTCLANCQFLHVSSKDVTGWLYLVCGRDMYCTQLTSWWQRNFPTCRQNSVKYFNSPCNITCLHLALDTKLYNSLTFSGSLQPEGAHTLGLGLWGICQILAEYFYAVQALAPQAIPFRTLLQLARGYGFQEISLHNILLLFCLLLFILEYQTLQDRRWHWWCLWNLVPNAIL